MKNSTDFPESVLKSVPESVPVFFKIPKVSSEFQDKLFNSEFP